MERDLNQIIVQGGLVVSSRTAISRRPILAMLASLCALLGALGMSASALASAPEAPVTLTPAKEVTTSSATLEGELNPHISAKVTWQMFLSNPGGVSCHEGITVGGEGPLDGEAIPVNTTARDLQPSSVYRFCVVAFNEGAETSGNEVTFKTLELRERPNCLWNIRWAPPKRPSRRCCAR